MTKWFTPQEKQKLGAIFNIDYRSGSNKLLDKYMNTIRERRPVLASDKKYELYESNDLIQLWFQTPPCRFSVLGKCTMCNYWNGKYNPNLIQSMVKEIVLPDTCRTLLINTCGSCLDPQEVPPKDLIRLLDWVQQCPAKRVIFETHWSTLSTETLELINRSIPDKKIFYEIGIESTNDDTLFYLLNKPSSHINAASLIKRIHDHNACCIMNVVLGIPFMNPQEQIMDTVSSIQNLLEQHADYIVLFPINIKPYTMFMQLYNNDCYSTVPIKLLAYILLKYFPDKLDRINTAWFGDRHEEGVIPPYSCDICGETTISLFKRYNDEEKTEIRRRILEQIMGINCGCLENYLSKSVLGRPYKRVKDSYTLLRKWMND